MVIKYEITDNIILYWLDKCKLTQESVADRVGITTEHFNRIINGHVKEPGHCLMKAIAEAISPKDIKFWSKKPATRQQLRVTHRKRVFKRSS